MRFLLILVFSVLLPTLNADSKSRILVYSWANDDYVRLVDENGSYMPEFCAFLEGNYYPDPLEEVAEEVSFDRLIKLIAPEMMKHNFILDQPPEIVDYILLVNWGFTEEVSEDSMEFFEEDIIFIESEDGYIEEVSTNSSNQFSSLGKDNAKLIGAMKMSQLYPYSLKRKLLLEASEEKRLFVNITAFSKLHLLHKRDSDALKAEWITFLSIPFYNIGIDDAVKSIAEIGSRYMGNDWETPSFLDFNDKNFSTQPNKLEYLGVEED